MTMKCIGRYRREKWRRTSRHSRIVDHVTFSAQAGGPRQFFLTGENISFLSRVSETLLTNLTGLPNKSTKFATDLNRPRICDLRKYPRQKKTFFVQLFEISCHWQKLWVKVLAAI